MKQRIRSIKRRAAHGGKLCGADSESVPCGVTSCDKDCTLAAWSGWSKCSKACGGGFQQQHRRILTPASGLGNCYKEDSEQRLRYRRCNPDKCSPKSGALLKCAAKVDVVIMLDSSGSLGETGWAEMKQAAASLTRAFGPSASGGNGAQAAVLLYSGPKNMESYKKCTGQSSNASSKLDMAEDCKMVWVSHFTTNTAGVANSIGNLLWQKGSTMTSQALATAEAELVYGRADAQQVVITLADSLPMMPKRTAQAAESLQKKARLMWAVAGSSADVEKFAAWASRPVADNVIHVDTIADLAKPDALNRIIAGACDSVK